MSDLGDPWSDDLSATEAARFLEDAALGVECAELRRSEVTWGDQDSEHPERSALESKARRVLRIGVRQMLEGNPNPEFLKYLAECIRRFLDGEEKSLDQALRVSLKRGRPAVDPAIFDSVVRTYLAAMHRLQNAEEAVRQRIALKWAFKRHHGKTPEQFRAQNRGADVDEGWIADRMMQTKRLLRSRGYSWLSTPHGQALLARYSYGSVILEIDRFMLAKVPVPLVPQAVRTRVGRLVLEANQLRDEAWTLERRSLDLMASEIKDTTKQSGKAMAASSVAK